MRSQFVALAALLALCAGPVAAQEPGGATSLKTAVDAVGRYLPSDVQLVVVADTKKLVDSFNPGSMLPADRVDPARLDKIQQMRLDYLKDKTGLDVSGITSLLVFATKDKTAGLVLLGARFAAAGSLLKAEELEEGTLHAYRGSDLSFDLVTLGETGVALFFEREHTRQYLAWLKEPGETGKSAAEAAAQLDRVPDAWIAVLFKMDLPKLQEEWRTELGFAPADMARIFFGQGAIRLELSGSKESLDGLMALYEKGRTMALDEVKKHKTVFPEDNMFAQAAYIAEEMLAQPVLDAFRPKLSEGGDTLSLDLDVPSMGAFWLLGTTSAIAIPAFVKYQRQAQTADAIEHLDAQYEAAKLAEPPADDSPQPEPNVAE